MRWATGRTLASDTSFHWCNEGREQARTISGGWYPRGFARIDSLCETKTYGRETRMRYGPIGHVTEVRVSRDKSRVGTPTCRRRVSTRFILVAPLKQVVLPIAVQFTALESRALEIPPALTGPTAANTLQAGRSRKTLSALVPKAGWHVHRTSGGQHRAALFFQRLMDAIQQLFNCILGV